MTTNVYELPKDLPIPQDDGGCAHLPGMQIPAISLPVTTGGLINLAELKAPRTVIYCYPMTGVPGVPLPDGWDMIPGARGCTPQSCAFRDHHAELRNLQADVYGFSTQTTGYQTEMAERLHLPFGVLSDSKFELVDALNLPTFETAGMRLVKRLTLIIRDGKIEHVLYPIFPSDKNAEQVISWLQAHPI